MAPTPGMGSNKGSHAAAPGASGRAHHPRSDLEQRVRTQFAQTTQIYLHANMQTKEDTLARTTPTGTKPGRYAVTDDALITFLNGL